MERHVIRFKSQMGPVNQTSGNASTKVTYGDEVQDIRIYGGAVLVETARSVEIYPLANLISIISTKDPA